MRVLCAIALAGAFFCTAPFASAAEVTLRSSVEAAGPAVTLGDFFADAGAAAGRAVGPAPGAGHSATFSARFVQAAARSAGLTWTPPDNLQRITVTGRAGDAALQNVSVQRTNTTGGVAAVRRGEIVTLVYAARGIQLTTRARAASDAAVGERVQLINIQSNRTIEATVTGPAAASASLSR